MRGVRHHADPAGGVIWVEGVVPPDEVIRVCGGVRHHAVRAGGTVCLRGVVRPDEGIRDCGG